MFAALLVGLVVLIQIGLLRRAYSALGLNPLVVTLVAVRLAARLLHQPARSSACPEQRVVSHEVVEIMGMPFLAPVAVDWPGTVLAINVGGAVIPILLSFYLLVRYRLWGPGLVAIAIVAFFVHQMATPIPGVGIAVPTVAPPLLAAFAGLVLSRRYAAPLAYIGGCIGVLVGADLLNLGDAAEPRRAGRLDRRRGHFRRRFPDRRDRRAARDPGDWLTRTPIRCNRKCLLNQTGRFCVYFATSAQERDRNRTQRWTSPLRLPIQRT